jgi:hypothetical protein
MRDRRRTPAGGVQAEKQQRYVQLIAQGVSRVDHSKPLKSLIAATGRPNYDALAPRVT